MLQLGSTGEAVTTLQQDLVKLGMSLSVDGDFGPQTLAAVEQFQADHGLQADGVVGPLTQAAISEALGSAPTPTPAPTGATPWMDWMRANQGEVEMTGAAATAFDNMVFSHTDFGSLDGTMESGCAATACAALELTGYTSPHSAAAISFKGYGTPCDLQPGCVIVWQWASGDHHVDFCDHIVSDTEVAGIGGNQSHMLQVSTYDRQYIIYTGWPIKA